MRSYLFAFLLLGLFAAAAPVRAADEDSDTMTVSATIANEVSITAGTVLDFDTLAPGAGETVSNTFTLVTNFAVDVTFETSAADLVNGASTINVTYTYSTDGGATDSPAFGLGETTEDGVATDVVAGSYTYTVEATIAGSEITTTTLAGTYSATLTISAVAATP
jgi:hypothetical protein